jgi:hypothetical protein
LAGNSDTAKEKLSAAIELYRRHGAGARLVESIEADFPRTSNAPVGPSITSQTPKPEDIFHQEGDYWTIAFEGSLCRLKHAKGLLYIAHLLRHPGIELSTVDLVRFAESKGEQPIPVERLERRESSIELRPDLGDAGAALDHQAKVDYRLRLRELRQEFEEAERFNDLGRKDRLRAEIDFLTAELTADRGHRHASRKAASHVERARLAVSKRIRSSLDEIRKANPALGKHLTKALRTGYRCAYLPERRTDWHF